MAHSGEKIMDLKQMLVAREGIALEIARLETRKDALMKRRVELQDAMKKIGVDNIDGLLVKQAEINGRLAILSDRVALIMKELGDGTV